MGDREMITDLLHTQKKATSDYNNYATESAHMEVQQVFLDLLKEEQHIGHDLFCQMSSRGWYPTEEAPQDKRCDLKAQFRGCECGCTTC
ncbi:MAG: spore coat protein [Clostridia bacterium]|nr:spore coat protein [Clostridia bacterium]